MGRPCTIERRRILRGIGIGAATAFAYAAWGRSVIAFAADSGHKGFAVTTVNQGDTPWGGGVVQTVFGDELDVADDGYFELWIGPEERRGEMPANCNFIRTSPQTFRISSTALSLGTTGQWRNGEWVVQGTLMGGLGYAAGHTTGNTTVGGATGRSGGSYGGLGQDDRGTTNAVYGDYTNPNDFGSGGGPGDQAGHEAAEAPARSADAARSRMASFQRGVREGRAAAPQVEEP